MTPPGTRVGLIPRSFGAMTCSNQSKNDDIGKRVGRPRNNSRHLAEANDRLRTLAETNATLSVLKPLSAIAKVGSRFNRSHVDDPEFAGCVRSTTFFLTAGCADVVITVR